MTTIFPSFREENPFAEATQLALGGVNQFVEQNAIDNLLKKINKGNVDPLTAILESGISGERQKQIADQFSTQAEQVRKQQENDFINNLTGNSFIRNPGSGTPATNEDLEILKEPTSPEDTPQNPQVTIRDYPDEKLQVLKGSKNPIIRNIANQEDIRRENEKKGFRADREFESKQALPFLLEVDKQRDNIRNRDLSGKLMLAAIQDEDLTFWSPDNLASLTGLDLFRTAKGQQFITAGKEFFLSNIQRAGTRPNQWIEQQIQAAMANIGTSTAAQMTATKVLLAGNEVDLKKQQISDQLQKDFKKDGGFVPGNIAAIVEEQLIPFADEIQANLAFDLRRIFENDKGQQWLDRNAGKKVSVDTPLTTRMARVFVKKNKGDQEKAVSQAKRLGYTIPTQQQFRRFEDRG